MHVLMRFALEKQRKREREGENNISLAFFLSFFFDTTYNFGRVSTLEPF